MRKSSDISVKAQEDVRVAWEDTLPATYRKYGKWLVWNILFHGVAGKTVPPQ